MPARRVCCVYPKCSSHSLTPGRSVFGFPMRDPARQDEWIRIMSCNPDDIHRGSRGVCDLHFNPKFIVSNPRRKILIGMAVPEPPPSEYQHPHQQLIEQLEDDFGLEDDGDDDEEKASCVRSEDDDGMFIIDYGDTEEADTGEAEQRLDDDGYEKDNNDDKEVHILKTEEQETTTAGPSSSLPIEISMVAAEPPSTSTSAADADYVSSSVQLRLVKPISITAVGSHKPQSQPRYRDEELRTIDIQPVPLKRQRVEEEPTAAPLIGNTSKAPAASPQQDGQKQQATAAEDAADSRTLPRQASVLSVRGVTHVQMPLSVFEAEQKMLRDELNYWKSIVVSFKQKLDDVEF